MIKIPTAHDTVLYKATFCDLLEIFIFDKNITCLCFVYIEC